MGNLGVTEVVSGGDLDTMILELGNELIQKYCNWKDNTVLVHIQDKVADNGNIKVTFHGSSHSPCTHRIPFDSISCDSNLGRVILFFNNLDIYPEVISFYVLRQGLFSSKLSVQVYESSSSKVLVEIMRDGEFL